MVLVADGAGIALRTAAELGRFVVLAVGVLALAIEAGHGAERGVSVSGRRREGERGD